MAETVRLTYLETVEKRLPLWLLRCQERRGDPFALQESKCKSVVIKH